MPGEGLSHPAWGTWIENWVKAETLLYIAVAPRTREQIEMSAGSFTTPPCAVAPYTHGARRLNWQWNEDMDLWHLEPHRPGVPPGRCKHTYSGVLQGIRTLECRNCDFQVRFVYPMAIIVCINIGYIYNTIQCHRSQQRTNRRTRKQENKENPRCHQERMESGDAMLISSFYSRQIQR